jgi:hydrogenase maturation protein HypF
LFKNICLDFISGNSTTQIITNFFYTLAKLVFTMADKNGTRDVALSGGVFQNATLVDMLHEVGEKKYNLYFNRELSPNDENISFGQIMVYLNCKEP